MRSPKSAFLLEENWNAFQQGFHPNRTDDCCCYYWYFGSFGDSSIYAVDHGAVVCCRITLLPVVEQTVPAKLYKAVLAATRGKLPFVDAVLTFQ